MIGSSSVNRVQSLHYWARPPEHFTRINHGTLICEPHPHTSKPNLGLASILRPVPCHFHRNAHRETLCPQLHNLTRLEHLTLLHTHSHSRGYVSCILLVRIAVQQPWPGAHSDSLALT